jgi:nitrogen fixation/metabolism regulation signal transduction histidine kinase
VAERPHTLRRLQAAMAVSIAGTVVLTYLLAGVLRPAWLVVAMAIVLATPLTIVVHGLIVGPVRRVVRALGDGLLSLTERDYGMRIANIRDPDVDRMVEHFNKLSEQLRLEHNDRYQREMLLETVLEAAPMAMILANEASRVVFANAAARALLHDKRPMDGHDLDAILAARLPEVRDAGGDEALVTVERGGETETLQVARRWFELSTQAHTLLLIRSMTRELALREAQGWKKAIRVVSHELNNSLAPITSLVHSARLILKSPEHGHRLAGVLETIEERAAHLRTFLEGYARLARLPSPTPRAVAWPEFIAGLAKLYSFRVAGALPDEPGWFDAGQLEQVMINLLKNALEAGGPGEEIAVAVAAGADGCEIRVMDRGKGMTDEELRNATLPFYSTKKTGSGLGLAVCRDIVETHGGRLTIARRDGGGVEVTVSLPGAPRG